MTFSILKMTSLSSLHVFNWTRGTYPSMTWLKLDRK